MMNSLVAREAAYIACRRIGLACAAAAFAPALSGCLEILSMDVPPPAQAVADVKESPCPAQDFAAFLDAFGESVEVQRGYTHIPLTYAQLSAGPARTPKEKTINAFEAIPIYDGKDDGGRILRNKARRRERGLTMRVEPDREENQNTKTVTVLLPHTGFRLEYQFASTESCWELVRINDLTK